jgi:hypothetical protein
MGAVGADDRKLTINEGRLKVIGDISAVLVEALGETPPEIAEREVMVAGDDDLRPGKANPVNHARSYGFHSSRRGSDPQPEELSAPSSPRSDVW